MESSLADHGVRKYDYETGRFISCDALWGKIPEWSPYQYGYNNPVIMKDDNGEWNILIHNQMINKSCAVFENYGFSINQITQISKGLVKGGNEIEFGPNGNDQAFHHMVGNEEAVQYGYNEAKSNAELRYNTWKDYYLNKFIVNGEVEDLGKYIHMVQDAYAPGHSEWGIYQGLGTHQIGDLFGDTDKALTATKMAINNALSLRIDYLSKSGASGFSISVGGSQIFSSKTLTEIHQIINN